MEEALAEPRSFQADYTSLYTAAQEKWSPVSMEREESFAVWSGSTTEFPYVVDNPQRWTFLFDNAYVRTRRRKKGSELYEVSISCPRVGDGSDRNVGRTRKRRLLCDGLEESELTRRKKSSHAPIMCSFKGRITENANKVATCVAIHSGHICSLFELDNRKAPSVFRSTTIALYNGRGATMDLRALFNILFVGGGITGSVKICSFSVRYETFRSWFGRQTPSSLQCGPLTPAQQLEEINRANHFFSQNSEHVIDEEAIGDDDSHLQEEDEETQEDTPLLEGGVIVDGENNVVEGNLTILPPSRRRSASTGRVNASVSSTIHISPGVFNPLSIEERNVLSERLISTYPG
eukprot:CAMPEP_0119131602 /NCGR_PEP_ID=MMETSP1310-20130426/10479_1 /TAXON_ID=464262 /ORGANISM="Genus nov. species nov., Strain RCC2339" /LENGTH=347 /DNA_ID=CAMNT_0007122187 /DNA_START=117 /DNA_END=1156 /DNA_ORIENTATION=-